MGLGYICAECGTPVNSGLEEEMLDTGTTLKDCPRCGKATIVALMTGEEYSALANGRTTIQTANGPVIVELTVIEDLTATEGAEKEEKENRIRDEQLRWLWNRFGFYAQRGWNGKDWGSAEHVEAVIKDVRCQIAVDGAGTPLREDVVKKFREEVEAKRQSRTDGVIE